MDFAKGLHKFGLWGSGIGKYDKSIGHKDLGSIRLSCDFGENITAYRNFTGLKSGNYKVSFYIKSKNIQNHPHTALWHFYDSGFGDKNPFRNKSGSFGWSKIEYITYVKNEFKFWLRLKSAGKVWFDDFKLEKVTDKIKSYQMTSSRLIGKADLFIKKTIRVNKSKRLLTNSTDSIIKSKYLNLYPSDFLIKDLNGFGRLVLDVFNPTNYNYSFYLVVQDDKSVNYWSQLNFKTTLGPGSNSLNLNLNRALGERGSVKFNRKIDFKNIKKIFLVVDPDKTGIPTNKNFIISKLQLDNLKIPTKPKGILAFDFSSHKLKSVSGFTQVTSQDSYSIDKGFGFVNPKFYRIYDAKYASSINQSSINVLESNFVIDIPNGEYELELNINGLGYWDVPFWKRRKVYLNNKLIVSSKRSNASDYLSDYFKFENIEPTPNDSLYDLYLSKIFKPVKARVWIRDKKMNFRFEGDATGVNLNSLIIWPTKVASIANIYLQELNDLKRKENDIISRKITSRIVRKTKNIKIGFLNPTLNLTYTKKLIKKNNLNFKGLSNESLFKIIQIKNNNDVSKLNFLFEGDNSKALTKAITFHPIKYQFSALDMNHETYKLMAKIVSPEIKVINLEPQEVRYVLVKVDFNLISKNHQKANLNIQGPVFNQKFTFDINKIKYKLPTINISTGFLGLDSIGPLYFKNKRLEEFKQTLRIKALRILAKNGFTSFSGLPRVEVTKRNDEIDIDDKNLRAVLKQAKMLNMGQAIFTYSGEFPKYLFNSLKLKSDYMQINRYFSNLNKIHDQKIVYTFSDEAGGYSSNVVKDIAKAKNLSKKIPNLLLGGFSGMHKETRKLNKYFDYGFYSSINKNDIKDMTKKGHFWGTYNGSVYPLSDPQFAFGVGLYFMEKEGLNHYLDWHLNATHNYPYFEFDGRETDSVMLYPRSNGDLYSSIKFEHAILGLNTYRKLKLLDTLESKMTAKTLRVYQEIKINIRSKLNPYNFMSYYHKNTININDINTKLLNLIESIK